MTTFIDFRYSAAQASALQHGFVEDGSTNKFLTDKDGYFAIDVDHNIGPATLLSLGSIALSIDKARVITLSEGGVCLRHSVPFNGEAGQIIGIRVTESTLGIKYSGVVNELSRPTLNRVEAGTVILSSGVRVMGQSSGRANRWGKIFYQRSEPTGPCIEIVMDWQNLQTGIPGNAVGTTEELLIQSNYKLTFASYACEESQAKASDLYRLFASSAKPEITLHIAPPVYTSANPNTVNIGIFVVESEAVAKSIVNRCNDMDALIVPTQFVAEALKKSGVLVPIYTIPHGLDLDFFTPVAKKTHLKGGKGFNILAIAAYSERKNIFHLARAYMEEFRITEDVALHLYIRPEYLMTQHNLLQEFTEWEHWHYNESGLILISTSYTSRERLRDLYANADLYLMPSNEGFGFTILEAMASGTPAIGLDHGGQTDFLNSKNGFLVPPGGKYICKNMDLLPYVGDSFSAPNIKALRRAMRHAFTNRAELLELGKEARRSIESTFAWIKVGKAIGDRIGEIFNEKQSQFAAMPLTKKKDSTQCLTWMVGVVDDADIGSLLPALAAEPENGREVICLFTRYGKYRDALKARSLGYLLYRWDTTLENLRILAAQLVKTPWAGAIDPEEKFDFDINAAITFLKSQPEDVSEVRINRAGSVLKTRFFRVKKSWRDSGGKYEINSVDLPEKSVEYITP